MFGRKFASRTGGMDEYFGSLIADRSRFFRGTNNRLTNPTHTGNEVLGEEGPITGSLEFVCAWFIRY
jgi:hypothetical protein